MDQLTAGVELLTQQFDTLKEDTEFLRSVITAAQNERTFRQLPYGVNADIVLPWLKQFSALLEQVKRETVMKEDPESQD